MIQFSKPNNVRMLELGGGDSRHPQADCMVDVRKTPQADFACDFNQVPLPIKDEDFQVVFAHFVLEHLSFRNVLPLLKDLLRILTPKGKVIFAIPNTQAQMEWVREHPEGWDEKSLFEAASEKLFGSQNMLDEGGVDHNTHKCYFDPTVAMSLFQEAGYCNILITPYGTRDTDMVVEATKPAKEAVPDKDIEKGTSPVSEIQGSLPPAGTGDRAGEPSKSITTQASIPRHLLYDRKYFNGGGYIPFSWDTPHHWYTFKHILNRNPESVLELGTGRGYVLKRLEDKGIPVGGLDISRHAYMTRACDGIRIQDVCEFPWFCPNDTEVKARDWDLCVSMNFLEHLPEEFIPSVIQEMSRTTKRGLHGVTFPDDFMDKTRVTFRSPQWWKDRFAEYAPGYPVEVFLKEELCIPAHADWQKELLQGDGKVKINAGCAWTMHHSGWINVDVLDLFGFAGQYGYGFHRHDLKQGIPFQTGSVDLIVLHHCLEHFTYSEASKILKEARRVLKSSGAMRITVPDAKLLTGLYTCQNGFDGYTSPHEQTLSDFDEINEGAAYAKTAAAKLHALLWDGHQSVWDASTMIGMLDEAGFNGFGGKFRYAAFSDTDENLAAPFKQIQVETTENSYNGLSMFTDAIPKIG